jgi:hypothetical protein
MRLESLDLDDPALSSLEVFAHQLAVQHTVVRSPERNGLLSNSLLRWSEALYEAYRYFGISASREPVVTRG